MFGKEIDVGLRMMSEVEKIKSMQMEVVETLLRYLTEITNTDLALSEGQVRSVPEVALTINTILRDL